LYPINAPSADATIITSTIPIVSVEPSPGS
jgi:hypothetical protein